MTPRTSTERLLACLKRHNPTRVRAFASDDESRDIAVPTRRKRWTQVIEAIEARAWTRVELLNKAGEVIAYVDNTSPASELEELGASMPAGAGGQVLLAERIVAMVMRGQRETMAYRDAEVTALLKAQGDVVRELTAGVRALADVYREQVDAAEHAAEMRAVASNPSQVKELLDAAPALLQLLPLVGKMLNGDAPNGVKRS